MTFDYDELVKNYWDGLFSRLRNFTGGPAFLETWVHDEDHTRSILGLFEAAEASGQTQITLRVGPTTAPLLKISEIRQELSSLGIVKIEQPENEVQITVSFAS